MWIQIIGKLPRSISWETVTFVKPHEVKNVFNSIRNRHKSHFKSIN